MESWPYFDEPLSNLLLFASSLNQAYSRLRRSTKDTRAEQNVVASRACETVKRFTGADGKRRKRTRVLRVPVHPEEAEVIEAQARAAGLSVAAYLRNVGTGYEPRSVIDRAQVHEMLRINGDLGRLGGLLKLWLSQWDYGKY